MANDSARDADGKTTQEASGLYLSPDNNKAPAVNDQPRDTRKGVKPVTEIQTEIIATTGDKYFLIPDGPVPTRLAAVGTQRHIQDEEDAQPVSVANLDPAAQALAALDQLATQEQSGQNKPDVGLVLISSEIQGGTIEVRWPSAHYRDLTGKGKRGVIRPVKMDGNAHAILDVINSVADDQVRNHGHSVNEELFCEIPVRLVRDKCGYGKNGKTPNAGMKEARQAMERYLPMFRLMEIVFIPTGGKPVSMGCITFLDPNPKSAFIVGFSSAYLQALCGAKGYGRLRTPMLERVSTMRRPSTGRIYEVARALLSWINHYADDPDKRYCIPYGHLMARISSLSNVEDQRQSRQDALTTASIHKDLERLMSGEVGFLQGFAYKRHDQKMSAQEQAAHCRDAKNRSVAPTYAEHDQWDILISPADGLLDELVRERGDSIQKTKKARTEASNAKKRRQASNEASQQRQINKGIADAAVKVAKQDGTVNELVQRVKDELTQDADNEPAKTNQ